MNLRSFDDGMIAEAGRLLAQRHRRDRVFTPTLPARFEDPEVAATAVAATWKRPYSSGYAAFDSDALIGFLFGECIADQQRGRHVWMRQSGHALADGVDAELYRDLYAAAGKDWLARGHFDHFILIPAGDRGALEAFFDLSFGKEQAHAICDLSALTPSPPGNAGPWTIRAATQEDRNSLREAADWIPRRHADAPVWGAALPERIEERRNRYADVVDDETAIPWLAEEAGRLMGVTLFFREHPSEDDLLVDDDCVILSVGATRPEARGRGVATALTWRGLADAKARGLRICQADWRVTNLEASRFWPRFGFEPAVYRLVRRVDDRIIWAR